MQILTPPIRARERLFNRIAISMMMALSFMSRGQLWTVWILLIPPLFTSLWKVRRDSRHIVQTTVSYEIYPDEDFNEVIEIFVPNRYNVPYVMIGDTIYINRDNMINWDEYQSFSYLIEKPNLEEIEIILREEDYSPGRADVARYHVFLDGKLVSDIRVQKVDNQQKPHQFPDGVFCLLLRCLELSNFDVIQTNSFT